MRGNLYRIMTLVIAVTICTAMTFVPISVAEYCICSDLQEYESVSEQEMRDIKILIDDSPEIEEVLAQISSSKSNLDMNNAYVQKAEGRIDKKILVTIPVKETAETTGLALFITDSGIEEVVLITVDQITDGVLLSFEFENGEKIYIAEASGSCESQTEVGGIILDMQAQVGTQNNQEFWACFTACLWGIASTPLCVLACWECVTTGNGVACFACSACTVAAAVLCAWLCSGFGSSVDIAGSMFMTSSNDIYITAQSTSQINMYNQDTGTLIVSYSE